MLDKVLRERVIHNFLFYVIALFFVFFLSWAYIAEIDQVVRAEALVEPVGKVQQLQSRYGGSVVQMDVSVGDVVRENQVLIMLDTQEAQSTFDFTNQKIALLNTELSIYTPLVEAGIEPEITLVQIKQRLLDAKDQLNRAALQLQFSQILSPISGVITAVNLPGVGAVIRAGDVLAEVVPQEEYYLIKAKVLPKDIGKVSVGQPARISYTAYDFSRYGVMEGEVTKIAQNTTKTQQGEIYYDAWVKTEGSTFSKSDINPNILPGMIAQVDMLGEKRTIFEYIMSPLNRTATRALTEQ
jgi:multidrug efflux pump subunit AcrA (membrane-fusion protein)